MLKYVFDVRRQPEWLVRPRDLFVFAWSSSPWQRSRGAETPVQPNKALISPLLHFEPSKGHIFSPHPHPITPAHFFIGFENLSSRVAISKSEEVKFGPKLY